MPGIKGDDPTLRRKVLADLAAQRSRGGMRATPRSASSNKKKKISQVAGAKNYFRRDIAAANWSGMQK